MKNPEESATSIYCNDFEKNGCEYFLSKPQVYSSKVKAWRKVARSLIVFNLLIIIYPFLGERSLTKLN